MAKFDISYLSDYRETPLLRTGGALVRRVSPLVNNPGCLMVTDQNVYFQPAPINNVQKDPVTRFPLSGTLLLLPSLRPSVPPFVPLRCAPPPVTLPAQ